MKNSGKKTGNISPAKLEIGQSRNNSQLSGKKTPSLDRSPLSMVQQKTKSRHDQEAIKKSFNADLQILND